MKPLYMPQYHVVFSFPNSSKESVKNKCQVYFIYIVFRQQNERYMFHNQWKNKYYMV